MKVVIYLILALVCLELQSQVLWNVHQYYSQFSHTVTQRVKELSLPVEKKLRDFVKIARWNDINYWAVKETVDRTHRTLLKYIREYEVRLFTYFFQSIIYYWVFSSRKRQDIIKVSRQAVLGATTSQICCCVHKQFV